MFEKNLGMGFLLDFYGQMLTERMEAAFARLSGGKSLPPAEKTPA